MNLSKEDLHHFLEEKYSQYNRIDFISTDPISIPHLFTKKEDIEIEHVTTLANAATFLKEQSPDIVIIDNQLPDGLGLEYIKEIKSSYPLIKIIMITGNTDTTDKATALQNGADIFLAKPFTKEQIQAAIENVSSLKIA